MGFLHRPAAGCLRAYARGECDRLSGGAAVGGQSERARGCWSGFDPGRSVDGRPSSLWRLCPGGRAHGRTPRHNDRRRGPLSHRWGAAGPVCGGGGGARERRGQPERGVGYPLAGAGCRGRGDNRAPADRPTSRGRVPARRSGRGSASDYWCALHRVRSLSCRVRGLGGRRLPSNGTAC